MRRPTLTAVVVGSALSWCLSGCFLADKGPSRLDVLNETRSTIWLDDDPANVLSRRDKVKPGAYGSVPTDECTELSVEAQTKGGEVIATLDREWCPGQLWVIRGQADWSLSKSP